jgi:hypothetical protein
VRYADLTKDQQRVLLDAVEHTYLSGVLVEYSTGAEWPDRLPDVPKLAKIVQDFIDQGLVTLDKDSGERGRGPIDIPNEEAPAILGDPDNWWSPAGTRPIALAPTDKGLDLFQGEDVDL